MILKDVSMTASRTEMIRTIVFATAIIAAIVAIVSMVSLMAPSDRSAAKQPGEAVNTNDILAAIDAPPAPAIDDTQKSVIDDVRRSAREAFDGKGEDVVTDSEGDIASDETSSDASPDPKDGKTLLEKADGKTERLADILPIADTGLVAHKAVYDVRITRLTSGSPIVGVSGSMFFKWHDDCDAYNTDHRFQVRYDYTEQGALNVFSRYIAYESKDGRMMSYASTSDENGSLAEELRGVARRSGAGGKAINTKPDGLAFDLPEGFVFPTQHTQNILKHARAGDKFYHAVLFDGTDTDGPIEINAVIGMPRAAKTPSVDAIDPRLTSGKAWPVRMGFFSLKPKAGEEADRPLYEMEILLHDNGIVSDILVDYDGFSVGQKLLALEALAPAAGCAAR